MPALDIYVDGLTSETRIAYVEGGELVGLRIDRPQQHRRVGDVVLGRVRKVIGGINGAFLDIGNPEHGFLPFADKVKAPPVSEGDAVVVRVTRSAMAEKGARLALGNPTLGDGNVPPAVLVAGPDALDQELASLAHRQPARIVIDGADAWSTALAHVPASERDILVRHTGEEPLFDSCGIEAQIDAALSPVVLLPSGGQVHIRETPACVTIDVDSAAASDGRSRADTVRQINREAALTIARELRCRNLSGNIVIDFIASKNKKDGAALLDLLRSSAATDALPVEVKGWSRLGLVEVVRRRQAPSLGDQLCVPIALGDGLGQVKSPLTLGYAALRQAGVAGRKSPGRPVTVRCPPDVCEILHTNLSHDVRALEARLGSPLNLSADPAIPMDGLDVFTGA